MYFFAGLKNQLNSLKLPKVTQLSRPEQFRVVVTAFSRRRGLLGGTSTGAGFFEPFAKVLANKGVNLFFARTPKQLEDRINEKTVVVHVQPEDSRFDTDRVLDAQRRARIIFNHVSVAPLLTRKHETHRILSCYGVQMPTLILTDEATCFSNELSSSTSKSGYAGVISGKTCRDRYNTEVIDTGVSYRGSLYYTMVRLLCVGSKVVHAYARARNADEGELSVHVKNTPVDGQLVEYLQENLVNPNLGKFSCLAKKISDRMGPGFYAHDLLVAAKSREVYLCETQFKFDEATYPTWLASVRSEIKSHEIMFGSALARKSAKDFLAECETICPELSAIE